MDERPIRVLYVDDDEHDFLHTRDLLSRNYGDAFEIEWVSHYDAGLRAAKSGRYDVALVDYRLGPDDGLELVREAVLHGCDGPLILLTGSNDHATDLAASEAGAADYLVKGRLDAALLERAIRYAIRQKQTERALRRSEEHYRHLFESVPHPMLVCDDEMLAILDANPAAVQHYGYTRDELMHLTMVDFRPPEDAARFLAWLESHQTEPCIDAGCWRHRRKDGSPVVMAVVVNLVERASRRMRVVLARDVTEHRRAEEAVRRSEQQLRAVFDGAVDAMVLADGDGQYVDANPAACALFGLPREELLGRPITDFVVLEEPVDLGAIWLQFLAEGRYQGANRLRRPDGTVREIESSATAHVVPGRHLSVIRDVTERIQMEQALRASEERFRVAFAAAAAGMAIRAPDGRFLEVNQSLCEMTGHTEAELLAKDFQTISHPHDLEDELAQMHRMLGGEIRSFQLEKRYIHKRGDIVWVTVIASLVRGANGEPLHTVALVEDITRRKRAEARQARLLRQVKRARRRLQALSQRLIATQEAERRHLARELHDEIGQSLTALKLTVQSIPAVAEAAERESLVEDARQIVDRLIGQVRDMSLDLRPAMLDDFGLVPALRWYVTRFAQRTGVTARFVFDPELLRPAPATVETACYRIAQEALTNVSRHASAQHVWVELGGGDDNLSLTIRDDGLGFDSSTAHVHAARGSGLGLLGMRERAALLGGSIEVASAIGDGTTIRAVFPLDRNG